MTHIPLRLVSRLLLLVAILCLNRQSIAANVFVGLTDSTSGVMFSEANGVDASGNIVVGTLATDGPSKAFRWTKSAGLEIIEGTQQGWGVSGDGRIVVGSAINPSTGFEEPFRWSSVDSLQLLGAPNGITPDFSTWARGASYDGSVIVGQTRISPVGKAFRWTGEDGVVLVDSTADQTRSDSAGAVSGDGHVVVGDVSTQTSHVAYRWTAETGMTPLGVLSGQGYSEAYGVSADGKVTVGLSGVEAFRWTESTGMVALASAAASGPESIHPAYSLALSTTHSGEAIVGTSSAFYPYDIPGGGHAFVWTEAFGMESLHLVLENRFGLGPELNGWRLSEARAISHDGRAIVGVGVSPDGNTEAWFVRLDRPVFVPEPTSIALLLIGAASLSDSRRRRSCC